ncbi:ADL089Cp [Eremothecium gossypii ATCC 10895]|uniref:ADL089Cp n=1 Tax=Eremothecium gossypii (strain ATCC 10895 / CBS 109.51 / FGSC 9923 / NRRL Y-1056) TaxID=284811 RepID=Q75B03_EREGS|nr:ADL089Cp [Eremothecium gossypii ATCC 10895]AAS51831.2 ADL089Cp [Eremothecium gossypii ATCC 10895]AEY96128.1 FADL089Cp [Eremothecium gossypii FDAG1]
MSRHRRLGLSPMDTLSGTSRAGKPTRHSGERYQAGRQRSGGVVAMLEGEVPVQKRHKGSTSEGEGNGLLRAAGEGDEGGLLEGYLELVEKEGMRRIEGVQLAVRGAAGTLMCELQSAAGHDLCLLDLQRDARAFYFDMHTTCVGLHLNQKVLLLGERMEATAQLLIWSTRGDRSDTRLVDIERTLKEAGLPVSDAASKSGIEAALRRQLSSVAEEGTKRLGMLDKPLSSLNNTKTFKRKYGKSGQVISFPHTVECGSSDEERCDSPRSEISPKSFYGSDRSSPSKPDLADHTYSSGLRKSSRLLDINNKKQFVVEDEDDYEKPEVFKPTLHYQFSDDTKYTVTNQDFKCLYNHDWVNDTILDFFLKYYVECTISDSDLSLSDVHIFSSFFYTKLVSNPEQYYANVKKWVASSNLLEKKYIVMPINVNFHWFGCIITNLSKLLRFFREGFHERWLEQSNSDSNVNEKERLLFPVVTILVYDSLRQTHSREVEPIKVFLIDYVKDKYGFDLPKAQIRMKLCTVPRQPNMSDCGIHVILNTKKFFENPQKAIMLWYQKPSHLLTKEINLYFEKTKRKTARQDLRNVLWGLQNEQVLRDGSLCQSDHELAEADNHSDLEIIEDTEGTKCQPPKENDAISKLSESKVYVTSTPEETRNNALMKRIIDHGEPNAYIKDASGGTSGNPFPEAAVDDTHTGKQQEIKGKPPSVCIIRSSSRDVSPRVRRHLSSSPVGDTLVNETGTKSIFFVSSSCKESDLVPSAQKSEEGYNKVTAATSLLASEEGQHLKTTEDEAGQAGFQDHLTEGETSDKNSPEHSKHAGSDHRPFTHGYLKKRWVLDQSVNVDTGDTVVSRDAEVNLLGETVHSAANLDLGTYKSEMKRTSMKHKSIKSTSSLSGTITVTDEEEMEPQRNREYVQLQDEIIIPHTGSQTPKTAQIYVSDSQDVEEAQKNSNVQVLEVHELVPEGRSLGGAPVVQRKK